MTLSRENSNPAQEKLILKKYEDLMLNIAKLQKEKLEYESKKSAEEQEYIARRNSWVGKIQELVEKISVKFHINMANMGYNGQVELRKTDRINDYGIFMKVSFLKGQRLTQLNHSQHSGGEKRISTIMYLLALQN